MKQCTRRFRHSKSRKPQPYNNLAIRFTGSSRCSKINSISSRDSYHRNVRAAFCPGNAFDFTKLFFKHVLVQKQQSVKGLILARDRHLFNHGEMAQKIDHILLRERFIVLAFCKSLKMARLTSVGLQGFRRIMADFYFAVESVKDKHPTAAGLGGGMRSLIDFIRSW